MRRLFVFLAAFAIAACAGSPAGIVQPPDTVPTVKHDPYWGGVLDQRTLSLYPDTAMWIANVYILRPSDSLPMYDSLTIANERGSGFVGDKCNSFSSGQGYIGDYLLRVEFDVVVGPHDSLVSNRHVGTDTLAHYVTAIWDPILSPLPGWGDDADHRLIWRLTLTDGTPQAPAPMIPVAEPLAQVGNINWGQSCNL